MATNDEWQLNKNGKLKMGALVRHSGDTEPFGKVVHVTESEALVRRFDTGKREPMSLRSEVEFQIPTNAGEGEEPVKSKKSKTATDSRPVKSKKSNDDKKPSKPKRQKPEREEEEEADTDTDNNEQNEQEPEVVKKKSAKPAIKKDIPATKKDTTAAAGLWYTAEELGSITGHNPQWIGKNRQEVFEPGMWRINTEAEGRGRKPVIYSADALEVLRNTPIPTRGGGRRKESSDTDSKPSKSKKSTRKAEQVPLFTGEVDGNKVRVRQKDAELPASSRGRKKSSAVSDPASAALDAIEAAILAAENQRDAHAKRYESLIAGLRQHKADLEFLAAGIAG